MNGFLGGLVAITAPCYWVTDRRVSSAWSRVLVVLGVDMLEHLASTTRSALSPCTPAASGAPRPWLVRHRTVR